MPRPLFRSALFSLLLGVACSVFATEPIRIMQVTDYQQDQMLLFDSQSQFHLPDSLVDAIHHEVALTFQTEIVLTEHQQIMGVKYDRQRIRVQYHTLLQYSNFNNRYVLLNERNSNVESFSNLKKALTTLGTLAAFPVISLSELHPGQKYTLKLRIRLNRWRLPAPLVLNSLVDNDWQLDSGWFETTLYTPKSWL